MLNYITYMNNDQGKYLYTQKIVAKEIYSYTELK